MRLTENGEGRFETGGVTRRRNIRVTEFSELRWRTK